MQTQTVDKAKRLARISLSLGGLGLCLSPFLMIPVVRYWQYLSSLELMNGVTQGPSDAIAKILQIYGSVMPVTCSLGLLMALASITIGFISLRQTNMKPNWMAVLGGLIGVADILTVILYLMFAWMFSYM